MNNFSIFSVNELKDRDAFRKNKKFRVLKENKNLLD